MGNPMPVDERVMGPIETRKITGEWVWGENISFGLLPNCFFYGYTFVKHS